MKISGFSMVKNADKLYYPIRAAIESILPIVDEFVLALGDCDEDDNTLAEIEKINDPKFRVVHTKWDIDKYPRGMENAHQTDIAKSHCTGDWLFYVQADEVVHEKYLESIRKRCEQFVDDHEVEGLLFKYRHFWGDYDHHQDGRGWYKREIRIIRNKPDIHSWESAQSFRRIPEFDGLNYRVQEGTHKLKVVDVDAYIYHYGWVRPPHFMQKKKKSLDTIHKGEETVRKLYEKREKTYDYGPLGRCAKHDGSHPKVMEEWIAKFDWKDKLNYSRKELNSNREKHKHDRLKYKIFTFLENKIFKTELGGFHNFILLKKK